MVDLTTFLRTRLDEDEQAAFRATPGSWVSRHLGRHDQAAILQDTGKRTSGGELPIGPSIADTYSSRGAADATHIARHDPARVLAEVNAKRRIIDAHDYREPMEDSPTLGPAPAAEISYCPICQESECLTLRLLALPFADHPDYRPEWRP